MCTRMKMYRCDLRTRYVQKNVRATGECLHTSWGSATQCNPTERAFNGRRAVACESSLAASHAPSMWPHIATRGCLRRKLRVPDETQIPPLVLSRRFLSASVSSLERRPHVEMVTSAFWRLGTCRKVSGGARCVGAMWSVRCGVVRFVDGVSVLARACYVVFHYVSEHTLLGTSSRHNSTKHAT